MTGLCRALSRLGPADWRTEEARSAGARGPARQRSRSPPPPPPLPERRPTTPVETALGQPAEHHQQHGAGEGEDRGQLLERSGFHGHTLPVRRRPGIRPATHRAAEKPQPSAALGRRPRPESESIPMPRRPVGRNLESTKGLDGNPPSTSRGRRRREAAAHDPRRPRDPAPGGPEARRAAQRPRASSTRSPRNGSGRSTPVSAPSALPPARSPLPI